MENQINDACGVVGVFSPTGDAARVAFFGIFSLQHRGQESAGIATISTGGVPHIHRGNGLVPGVFNENDLQNLPGNMAIGHTRYSTTGISSIENAQPVHASGPNGDIYLAHNGNIVNSLDLRIELEELGATFTTTTDSEVAAVLLANISGDSWETRIKSFMNRAKGSYSITLLTEQEIYAFRDPLGFRPLCFGSLDEGWVVASETCALDNVGAVLERDIAPGEIIRFNDEGYHSIIGKIQKSKFCIFENIYFARPDSILDGTRVYSDRESMGAALFRQSPVKVDLVTAIPDSAIPAAVGYARESGIVFEETLIKNRNSGRTFIEPTQALREAVVKGKFTALKENIEGKKIVLIDDSIVRGTTTPQVVNLLKEAGAKEIHLRVCAPPIKYPCHYGIDMPSRGELIAANSTVDEIRIQLGVDSLEYLDITLLREAVGGDPDKYCDACFTGDYPIPVQLELDKFILDR
ncbi:MAG: amidophosphoribosyltransferase [Dehalococcoidia bacterium]